MNKLNLKSVIWKENDNYISQCLEVDISSYGKTKKEALDMLRDALKLYFQDMPLPNKTELIKRPSLVSIQLQYA